MKQGNKKRGIGKRLLWTAIASPLVMLTIYELRNTHFGALFFPVYMPWFILAAYAFPSGGNIAGFPKFILAGLGINFFVTWIVLLIAAWIVGLPISLFRKKRA